MSHRTEVVSCLSYVDVGAHVAVVEAMRQIPLCVAKVTTYFYQNGLSIQV
jgi:hypothetical protein